MVIYLLIHFSIAGEMILKARVFTCVEGINLQLLEKAIEEQRKYFQERRKDHEESI